jgi:hypothetical protein|tara:strand:+ start:320 stop:550 length:231 start_codon:yes stop_codon:yes gene_type:complete
MEKRDSNSNEKVIKDEIVFLNQDSNIRVALPLNDIGTIELYFYNYPKILLSLKDSEILSDVLTVAIQELTRRNCCA